VELAAPDLDLIKQEEQGVRIGTSGFANGRYGPESSGGAYRLRRCDEERNCGT